MAVAEDGEQAVTLVRQECPDVAVIDISMPKLDGIEATKEIKKICPQTAVIMISAYKHDHYILSSIKAGASGYLLKENLRGQFLVDSIRIADVGRELFDRGITEIMRECAVKKNKVGISTSQLGEHEMEVLRLATHGLSNEEIATRLCISDQTVATRFVNIYKKLEVES
jgi:DNA-binding NarL/FixJ family response regulator